MSEERGFEVVDRRRVRSGAETDEPPSAEGASTEADAPMQADADEQDEPYEAGEGDGFNPLAGVTVSGILRMTVGLLAEKAWAGIGLAPDPMTGQIARNLDEARRAIDVLNDLAKHLDADLAPEEKRELQTLLTNLRLNYVRQKDQPS